MADTGISVGFQNLELVNAFGNPVQNSDVQSLFEAIDRNQDNRISKKELGACFSSYNIDDDVGEIFSAMDADSNRMITFDEFENYLANIPADHFDVWSALLGQNHLEFEPTAKDYEIDYVGACKTRSKDWQGRCQAMEAFCRIVLEKATDEKSFRKLFQPMKEPLLTQLGDRRSIPVRVCCTVLAKLVMQRRNWLYKFADRILTVLFSIVRLNVEVMSESGDQCAVAFVKSMDDRKCVIVDVLDKHLSSKHEKVKIKAMEYLTVQIQKTDVNSKRYAKWFAKCMKMLKAGCSSSAAAVRQGALQGLAVLHPLKKSEVDKVVAKLTGAMKKKWKKTLNETYTSTETPQKKRLKQQRVPTSVNIKKQMIAAGLIDADPNDPDLQGDDNDGFDTSDTSSTAPGRRPNKNNLSTPKRSVRERRQSSNINRKVIELEMELQRAYEEIKGLRQTESVLEQAQHAVERLTFQNEELRKENIAVRAEIVELQGTLAGVTDILDQFDELQEECETLHRENQAKNQSLETAIQMIQSREEEVDALRDENVELTEMCQTLLEQIETDGDGMDAPESPITIKNIDTGEEVEPRHRASSRHMIMRDEMLRRLSSTIHDRQPHAPRHTKQQLWKTLTTENNLGLPKHLSETGGMSESQAELMNTPAIPDQGQGGDDDMNAGLKSPNVGNPFEQEPEEFISGLPDMDDMPVKRRRNTQQHRKRITRSQSFFKKLLKKHEADPEETEDAPSVWE